MNVYIDTCEFVLHIYIHICRLVDICTHTQAGMHAYTCKLRWIYVYTMYIYIIYDMCTDTQMHTCRHTLQENTYVYMYIHIHIYIYI